MGSGSFTFMLIIATPILTGNLKLLEPLFGSILSFVFGLGHFPSIVSIIGSVTVGFGIYYMNWGFEEQNIENKMTDDLLEVELEDSNVIVVH